MKVKTIIALIVSSPLSILLATVAFSADKSEWHGYVGGNIGMDANKPIVGMYFKQQWYEIGFEVGYLFKNSFKQDQSTQTEKIFYHETTSRYLSTILKGSVFIWKQLYLTVGAGQDWGSYQSYRIINSGPKVDNHASNSVGLSYQAGIGYQPVEWLKIEPMYYHNQRGDFFLISTKIVF